MVPVVGFISWLVGLATIAIVTILAIVIIGEGRTSAGVFILLAAYIAAPVYIVVAPVASSAIFLNTVEKVELPEIEINANAETDQRVKIIKKTSESIEVEE